MINVDINAVKVECYPFDPTPFKDVGSDLNLKSYILQTYSDIWNIFLSKLSSTTCFSPSVPIQAKSTQSISKYLLQYYVDDLYCILYTSHDFAFLLQIFDTLVSCITESPKVIHSKP